MITLFFIYQGLSSMYYYKERAVALDRKLYNMEAHLQNNWPLFAFRFREYLPLQHKSAAPIGEPTSTILSQLIIFGYGFTILTLACLMFFFDENQKRSVFVQFLVLV